MGVFVYQRVTKHTGRLLKYPSDLRHCEPRREYLVQQFGLGQRDIDLADFQKGCSLLLQFESFRFVSAGVPQRSTTTHSNTCTHKIPQD